MKALTRRTIKLLSRIFLQGLVVVLPITATLAVVYWFAAVLESFLGGLIQALLPNTEYWTGAGLFLGVLLVFVVGLFIHTWFTRMLLARTEAMMESIPIVKSIYASLRDITRYVSGSNARQGFHQVVTVSVTEQIKLIGFVTNENSPIFAQSPDTNLVGVYLPMSYQIGGYTAYLPRSAVEPVDMKVEDAIRFALTAGMSVSGDKYDEETFSQGKAHTNCS